jgi:glutamate:GABA antiporter
VPAGLVIAELGSAFPNQGGPYVWTRLAFGRYAGSLVALIYFVETPVWVGGSAAITAVTVADRLLVPREGGWRVAVALAFIWARSRWRSRPCGSASWSPGSVPLPRSGCSPSSP